MLIQEETQRYLERKDDREHFKTHKGVVHNR